MAYDQVPEVAQCEKRLRNLLVRKSEQGTINEGTTSNKIEFATQEYNTAVCYKIASEFLDRLPRELHDMVYSYLVSEQITICRMPPDYCLNDLHVHEHFDDHGHVDISAQNSVYSVSRPYPDAAARTQLDRLCPQPYRRDNVIGVGNARGLMESFYQTYIFHVRSHCSSREDWPTPEDAFAVILDNDYSGLDFEPMKLISQFVLELYVHPSVYSEEETAYRNSVIQEWPGQLSCLKKTANIEVQLSMLDTFPEEEQKCGERQLVEEVMEVMAPRLVELRRAGHRVTVALSRYWAYESSRVALRKCMARVEQKVRGEDVWLSR